MALSRGCSPLVRCRCAGAVLPVSRWERDWWQAPGGGSTMPGMGGDAAGARVVVGLLGPVEIGPAGGVMAQVAQPRLRVLLGLLSVVGGRIVTAESLVDGLWGEEWSPA